MVAHSFLDGWMDGNGWMEMNLYAYMHSHIYSHYIIKFRQTSPEDKPGRCDNFVLAR